MSIFICICTCTSFFSPSWGQKKRGAGGGADNTPSWFYCFWFANLNINRGLPSYFLPNQGNYNPNLHIQLYIYMLELCVIVIVYYIIAVPMIKWFLTSKCPRMKACVCKKECVDKVYTVQPFWQKLIVFLATCDLCLLWVDQKLSPRCYLRIWLQATSSVGLGVSTRDLLL